MTIERYQQHRESLMWRYGISYEQIDSFMRSARRYEKKLERIAEKWCNDYLTERQQQGLERAEGQTEENAKRNLSKRCRNKELFLKELKFNGDPRGYMLKLEFTDETPNHIWRDWGGYGIIAPDKTDN